MRIWQRRGMILVTAMFVVLVIHALVGVTLLSLRSNTGNLKASGLEQQAELRAHSAALFALDKLHGSNGSSWELQHSVASRTDVSQPPPEADQVASSPNDSVQLRAAAWVEETPDPKLRTVWGACFDGEQWHFSTAVAVRREVNPGLLFGVRKGLVTDEFFFRPMNGNGSWNRAPSHPSINNTVYDCSASRDGKLYILEAVRSNPGAGVDLQISALDTNAGINGEWSNLGALPSGFRADPTGLAVGLNELYVAGTASATNTPGIMALPLSSGGTWGPLTALPGAVQMNGLGQPALSSFPFQFTDLKTGPEGELYLQIQLQTNSGPENTFARYQDGDWAFFPKPQDAQGLTRRGLLPIEVDDLGNTLTFTPPQNNQPGQIYRFAPTGNVHGQVIQGTWKSIPTPAANDEIRAITVDTEGNLFAGIRDRNVQGFSFQDLKQLPLRAHQDAREQDLSFPTNTVNLLEAGGQGPTGGLEYVPVSWY